jgi:uncharacterized protein
MAQAIGGGVLIGFAAGLLWLLNGRILGVSGIVGGILNLTRKDTLWRVFFLLGILSGGFVTFRLRPHDFDMFPMKTELLLAAGLLVGFGTRLGNGCTSGHGVCGISRFSMRSIVATLAFMAAGMLTVGVIRHFMGGL